MRFGPGLVLIAVGAILRFGISTVSTHGIAIHTIGDILMLVGLLGIVLAVLLWAPWTRNRRVTYREEVPPGEAVPPRRYREERVYEDDYPYEDEYRGRP